MPVKRVIPQILACFGPRIALALTLLLLAGPLTACKTYPSGLPEQEVHTLARQPYPEDAPYGDDYDIAVIYHDYFFRAADIQLINREASSLGPGQLWINEQYVSNIDEPIQIGENNWYILTDFINFYREPFPVGLFFTPDSSRAVVLVELYDPETQRRHRLYVQKPEIQVTLD